jgi:ribosome biogenesis protein BRX1
MINEIAQAKSADTTLFFDVRKRKDLFLWASKTPSGPSVKFHVVNVHTMEELRLTGNALKGSRPVLSFDRAFDDEEGAPHLRLIRELLVHAFATPRGHPKSQPFHDRVMSFGWVDGKVWVRNYQVLDRTTDAKEAAKLLAAGEQPTVLVEIGPRFVLDVVRVFQGSFGGPTLWSSPTFVSPHQLRLELNKARGQKYGARQAAIKAAEERRADAVLPQDPVRNVFRDGLGAPAGGAEGGAGAGEGKGEDEGEGEGEGVPQASKRKAKKAKVAEPAAAPAASEGAGAGAGAATRKSRAVKK